MEIGVISNLHLEEVKSLYKKYLSEQNLSKATVKTALTDTFYIWRYSGADLFWDVVTSDDFDNRSKDVLSVILKAHSKGNPIKLVNSYVSHLRRFCKFLLDESSHASQNKFMTEVVTPRTPIRSKGETETIPKPSIAELEYYLGKWSNLKDYSAQEVALDKLFHELCPGNIDLSDVLLKSVTLNDFYSTNIFSIFPVARHIVNLNIDEKLRSGDVSLVDSIKDIIISGKQKSFYSFATKYCSHHNDKDFPIYDSYVDKVLRYYRKLDGFSEFNNNDLKIYQRFKEILIDFKKFYGLEQFTLKQIDQYLWLFGKKHFPKKYKS